MKINKNEPTPYLSQIKSNRQIFSYSENKLLDQITMEIMEAWREDLKTIRNHHIEILESEKSAISLSNKICNEFPKLEKFLLDNEFILKFSKLNCRIEEITESFKTINQIQSEILKEIFDIKERLSYERIEEMKKNLVEISKQLIELKKEKLSQILRRFFKFFRS